jgi:hypothetical protein
MDLTDHKNDLKNYKIKKSQVVLESKNGKSQIYDFASKKCSISSKSIKKVKRQVFIKALL